MSSFHKGIEEGIVHVLAKSLPAVFVRLEQVHFLSGADRRHCLPIEFDSVERISVRTAIVHVESAIIIGEKVRIPSPDFELFDERIPFISGWIGAHPDGEILFISRAHDQDGISDDAYRRSAEFVIDFVPGLEKKSGMKFPIRHVGARPIAPLIGRE